MTITFSQEVLDIFHWQYPLKIDFAGSGWLNQHKLTSEIFSDLLILVCMHVPYSYFLYFFNHVFLQSLTGAGESYSQLSRSCSVGPISLGYPTVQHFLHQIDILFTYCVIYCECRKARNHVFLFIFVSPDSSRALNMQ